MQGFYKIYIIFIRYHCKARVYKYYFAENNMNIELMKDGCKNYIGKHDFRNFCKVVLTN